MKPKFALNLSHEGISILHRTKVGWMCVGDVSLDDPNLGDQLAVLRRTAGELESGGVTTKLIIPNSQILYTDVHAPGPDIAAQIVQIRQGLEGKTPYNVRDLVFDWRSDGQSAQVAVVFRESLDEAESFAVQYGFNPVSFVAIPEFGVFEGEPFFGATNNSVSLLGYGEEVEPDPDPMIILGTDRPYGKAAAQVRQGDSDRQAGQVPSALQQSQTSAPGQQPHPGQHSPPAGHPARRLVRAEIPMTDIQETVRLPLRGDQGLTRMPVTSSRIAGSTELRSQGSTATRFPVDPRPRPTPGSPPARSPSQTAGYRKLGPASSLADFHGERYPFDFQRPYRRRRWWRPIIFLLALLLVVGLCVGVLIWISPSPVESSLGQLLGSRASQQTADDSQSPLLDSDATVQLPFPEQVPERSTGPPLRQTVQARAPTMTADRVPGRGDVSGSPPPDRILHPPPSIAESERTYIKTGIWPLDPVQPVGMTGEGRFGVIYVAAVDRVDPPTPAASALESGFVTANPGLPSTLEPIHQEESGFNWQGLLDELAIRLPGMDADRSTHALRKVPVIVRESPDVSNGTRSATNGSSGPLVAHGDPSRLDRAQSQPPEVEPSTGKADALPSEVTAEDSREMESSLAAMTSPLPVARPEGLGLAAKRRANVEASTRTVAAESPGTAAASTKRAPDIPSRVSVASRATQRDAIDLGRINLIGTFGTSGERYALVRLRSGRIVKDVKVGDRIDGGRVTAIGAGELHYVKNGRSIALRMPSG